MKKISIILFAILISSCKTAKKDEPKAPNIVFIFADDMTYSAVHALGNNEVMTPNIDRLVKNGTTFTNAYNMGAWSGAICAASRAMLISGRSVWEVNDFRHTWLKNQNLDKTWGKLMENKGYETYMTGKWHVDAKADSVFNHVVHVRPGMPGDAWNHNAMVQKFKDIEGTDINPDSFMPIGYNRPLSENDTTWTPTDPKFGGYWQGGKHWSEVLKDDALSYIEKAKHSDKPFFMYLAFNAPHDPRQSPQEYLDMYPLVLIPREIPRGEEPSIEIFGAPPPRIHEKRVRRRQPCLLILIDDFSPRSFACVKHAVPPPPTVPG